MPSTATGLIACSIQKASRPVHYQAKLRSVRRSWHRDTANQSLEATVELQFAVQDPKRTLYALAEIEFKLQRAAHKSVQSKDHQGLTGHPELTSSSTSYVAGKGLAFPFAPAVLLVPARLLRCESKAFFGSVQNQTLDASNGPRSADSAELSSLACENMQPRTSQYAGHACTSALNGSTISKM
jgi:hypothetical protein